MAARSIRSLESGQTVVEYAILLAAIGLACLLAVLVLGGGIRDLFGSTGSAITPAALLPPSPSAQLTYPTTVDECVNGGWKNFAQFDDEAECKTYVDGLTP